MKQKKSLIVVVLCILLLTGCGKQEMLFENVPDPKGYFSEEAVIDIYDFRNMKGAEIEIVNKNDAKEAFSKYTKACEELDCWTEVVFSAGSSWCYETADGKWRLAVNLYEETGKVSICLINLEEKENEK